MTTYKFGIMQERETVLLIVWMDRAFGRENFEIQKKTTIMLQKAARDAGHKGRVIPCWTAGGGRVNYFAPPNMHDYLKEFSATYVRSILAEELRIDDMKFRRFKPDFSEEEPQG